MHPVTEPHTSGRLAVGDGHELHWQIHGNPTGKPVVVLHGGPGAGLRTRATRLLDPAVYRVVLFDQRGCGRSTPHAGEPEADLSTNTTDHLVADLELLRASLDVERWLVLGASWGAVLGLVYAQRFPERVTGLVLAGVATGRRVETDLLTRGLGEVFPEAWREFSDFVGAPEGDLSAAYLERLVDPDPLVHLAAADAWCAWEEAVLPQTPGSLADKVGRDRLAFARLVAHYWAHGSWLRENEVLDGCDRLAGVPGVVVQGELDLINLVGTPWLLDRAWTAGELVVVRETAHGGSAAMSEAWKAAADSFR
ncbi:prolyl aminopeptidase [Actinosynnema sp.]|uniref:prolyl aminopeptidase n=1 Tax=Actinosynnema sp. TaxID=1872144 RepID=UPI003F864410